MTNIAAAVMAGIRALLASEPAVTISVVAAGLALLVTFGVTISDQQINAVKDFVTALLAFAAAVGGIRRSVYSANTHEKEVQEAAVASDGFGAGVP